MSQACCLMSIELNIDTRSNCGTAYTSRSIAYTTFDWIRFAASAGPPPSTAARRTLSPALVTSSGAVSSLRPTCATSGDIPSRENRATYDSLLSLCPRFHIGPASNVSVHTLNHAGTSVPGTTTDIPRRQNTQTQYRQADPHDVLASALSSASAQITVPPRSHVAASLSTGATAPSGRGELHGGVPLPAFSNLRNTKQTTSPHTRRSAAILRHVAEDDTARPPPNFRPIHAAPPLPLHSRLRRHLFHPVAHGQCYTLGFADCTHSAVAEPGEAESDAALLGVLQTCDVEGGFTSELLGYEDDEDDDVGDLDSEDEGLAADVGSYCAITDQGGLVHPKTSVQDQDELTGSSLLQIPLVVRGTVGHRTRPDRVPQAGTVNRGSDVTRDWCRPRCERLVCVYRSRDDRDRNQRNRDDLQACQSCKAIVQFLPWGSDRGIGLLPIICGCADAECAGIQQWTSMGSGFARTAPAASQFDHLVSQAQGRTEPTVRQDEYEGLHDR
ncbi:hypothetical protein GGX14DRAFT_587412 [Mycena pura]|uniref:Uncharacterized protein n=1 Tax=Mycena pura TaxID=153505 RepID=A0AAD6Y2W8_9AGAR|nr:hypothetical protein GGX14DRAFT_587412 [Mycena pura]